MHRSEHPDDEAYVKNKKFYIKKASVDRSEVARHVWEEGHCLDWSSSGPIDREGRWKRRQIKEAYWSQKLDSKNRTFYSLSDAWLRV